MLHILNSINRENFAKEIKKLKIEKKMYFEINDAILKNVNILMYYLKLKKVKHVLFTNNLKDKDAICLRFFFDYFQNNFIYLSEYINIKFIDIEPLEIKLHFGERIYLNYCKLNQIKTEWISEDLEKERKKINKNKYLLKYKTFSKLIDYQEKNPFTYFNFPHENNADRFVFYFNIYNDSQKKEILELITNLGLDIPKLKKLISDNIINKEIFYYAFGFLYKKGKLTRFTLYTKFDYFLIHNQLIPKFIKEKHGLNININKYKNIWYYAIDFYTDGYEEIKFYDEPYLFKNELEDKIVKKILYNKMCVRVLKYRNNNIIATKYEFEKKYFSNEEIKKLEEKKIVNKNSKIFAIYIKNFKIIKNVSYEL